jgi:hypothetical protein
MRNRKNSTQQNQNHANRNQSATSSSSMDAKQVNNGLSMSSKVISNDSKHRQSTKRISLITDLTLEEHDKYSGSSDHLNETDDTMSISMIQETSAVSMTTSSSSRLHNTVPSTTAIASSSSSSSSSYMPYTTTNQPFNPHPSSSSSSYHHPPPPYQSQQYMSSLQPSSNGYNHSHPTAFTESSASAGVYAVPLSSTAAGTNSKKRKSRGSNGKSDTMSMTLDG